MPFPDAKYPPPRRVLVEVYEGCAEASVESGVDWELIDWDSIRSGDRWDRSQIDRLAQWGRGFLQDSVIESLRRYTQEAEEK